MSNVSRMTLLAVLVAGSALAVNRGNAQSVQHPNVILFLVDDLGWADLGCYGSTFHETPHIDQLADSGVRLTQAYAAASVCSPTRASILTGRHPVRLNITDWIPGASTAAVKDARFQHVHDRDNLALSEVTLAEYLKQQANYATYFVGKWHLGDPGHWPRDQGFDVNIAGNSKGSPPGGYYAPWKNPTLKAKSDQEYLTTRLTDESIQLIRDEDRPDDQPFFLMLSYYNVHTPITADRRTIEHYQSKAESSFQEETPFASEHQGMSRMRQDNPQYASMVTAVDTSIGRILDALNKDKLDDNTIIVFFSDNGGLCTTRAKRGPTCNLPLRSGKGWLYEGGIREPMIIRGPGIKPVRGGVSDAVAVSTDIFPTVIELAGLPAAPELHLDGKSLVGSLRGERSTERTLHWHYPHYHGSTWRPGAAIRDGDMKLIEFYEDDTYEMYDLAADPGEQHDLAPEFPSRAAALRRKLAAWQQDMKAKMPVEQVR